jgi:hypothetical protein
MCGKRFVATLIVITGGGLASAETTLWERIQIHGFASQAVVTTSDNHFFGDSPNASFDFTELGLNGSFQLNPKVLFSAQVLSRRAGEMYDGEPSLDYALVDFTFLSGADRRVGARVGRIKNPLGLYNETRDVPFTRPGIFLPQVVYYDKLRNLILSSDGLMLYGETFEPWGNLSLTLGGGRPVIDDNVEWAFLAGDYDGSMESDGYSLVGSLWYETQDGAFKAGLSAATAPLDFDPGANSILGPGNIDFTYWIGSLQYNTEDFTLSAEYSRLPLEWSDFGPFWPFGKQTTEGYYLQGAYRLLPELEFMLRYEEGFADRNNRSGKRLSALTGGVTPPFDFYSKIFTAGLRWDILPNLMLRVEYQRQQGTYTLSIRENPDPSQLVEDWDVFAASISVRF